MVLMVQKYENCMAMNQYELMALTIPSTVETDPQDAIIINN